MRAARPRVDGPNMEVDRPNMEVDGPNMEHIRQSRPDSGLGLQAKVLEISRLFPLHSEVEGSHAGGLHVYS